MGVKLTPLLTTDVVKLSTLTGKKIVVDGCNLLFRYISKIRKDGEILYNDKGDPVSHVIGVFYFCVNLIERRIRPIFVFDGYPPNEKRPKSPEKIQQLVKMWQIYKKQDAHQKNHRIMFHDTLFLYDKIISDLQNLVRFMGFPVVRGLSEGEAQGVRLIQDRKAYSLISEDQDCLLFGCPRPLRKFNFQDEICYTFDLAAHLGKWGITQRQLIDLAILIGTDYNEGITGIGPKKALQLLQEYKQLENIPDLEFPFDIDRIRHLFLAPATIAAQPLFRAPNTKYLTYYLSQKGWNPRRIEQGIGRLRSAFKGMNYKQADLMAYV